MSITADDFIKIERTTRDAVRAAKVFATGDDVSRLNQLEYIVAEVRHYAQSVAVLRDEYEGRIIGQDEEHRVRKEIEDRLLRALAPARL